MVHDRCAWTIQSVNTISRSQAVGSSSGHGRKTPSQPHSAQFQRVENAAPNAYVSVNGRKAPPPTASAGFIRRKSPPPTASARFNGRKTPPQPLPWASSDEKRRPQPLPRGSTGGKRRLQPLPRGSTGGKRARSRFRGLQPTKNAAPNRLRGLQPTKNADRARPPTVVNWFPLPPAGGAPDTNLRTLSGGAGIPLLLAIRNSDGDGRRMEVRE